MGISLLDSLLYHDSEYSYRGHSNSITIRFLKFYILFDQFYLEYMWTDSPRYFKKDE